jgi:protein SCO1/2
MARRLARLLVIAVLLAVALLTAQRLGWVPEFWHAHPIPVPVSTIGGPFRLATHRGDTLSSAALAGRPFAVFFGFTSCPVICPTTLTDLSQRLRELGDDADSLAVLMVSVDPGRDSVAALARYLEGYDRRIVGLTGPAEGIAALARAYGVYYQRVELDGGDYTVDHSTSVFLMDRQGRFVDAIAYEEAAGPARQKLRRLVRD